MRRNAPVGRWRHGVRGARKRLGSQWTQAVLRNQTRVGKSQTQPNAQTAGARLPGLPEAEQEAAGGPLQAGGSSCLWSEDAVKSPTTQVSTLTLTSGNGNSQRKQDSVSLNPLFPGMHKIPTGPGLRLRQRKCGCPACARVDSCPAPPTLKEAERPNRCFEHPPQSQTSGACERPIAFGLGSVGDAERSVSPVLDHREEPAPLPFVQSGQGLVLTKCGDCVA